MSGFLSKIVIKSITKVIKSTSKFDIAIDDIIDKFKDSCPPKKELLRIIKQKNQISNSLSQVLTILNTLNTTTNSAKNLITTLDITVKIIKSIPVPTAVGGVGIPIKVITTLADTLDVLSNVIAASKGAIDILPPAYKQISSSANDIISKLNQLDLVLNPCINDIMQDLNEEEKELFLEEIDNNVLEVGQFSSNDENLLDNNVLLERLQPTSTNPLYHKSFKLTLEIDTNNPFSIPSRRIKGLKEPNEILYNTFDGSYSYTSNPTILINEIKFVIDTTTDYEPLIDLTVQSNGIENFPFGDEGGPLEIRKVYEIIETYNEKIYNGYWNIIWDEDKYFVKIRDYKYDTFTKSWDIIDTYTYYGVHFSNATYSDPRAPLTLIPPLTEIINSSYIEWGELINNVGGTIIVKSSTYPFLFLGEYDSQFKKTFEIIKEFTNDFQGIPKADFKIRKYSWNAGNTKWDLISSILYNNQRVPQFINLLLNDSLIAGEHNALLSGDITPLTFLPFPPFGTNGYDGEIRQFQGYDGNLDINNYNLYIFQDNEWVPYTSTLPPFGFPGIGSEIKRTYQLLNTNFNTQTSIHSDLNSDLNFQGTGDDIINTTEVLSSYTVRIRVYRWDGSLYSWNEYGDDTENLSPSDYQYYQNNHINWNTLSFNLSR